MNRKKYSDSYNCYNYEDDYKKHKSSCRNSDQTIVKVYCNCKSDFERQSAFKATQNTFQPLIANQPTRVLFPVEVFDINNEYDPSTSIFVPRQNGIYTFNTSIIFTPTEQASATIILDIRVNGISVSRNEEGGSPNESLIVKTSTIALLQAGDRVDILAEAGSANGTIAGVPSLTYFEGAQIS
ncbi:hypothetical protein AXW78_12540 [Bacillus thuringiensis]|uniref:Uncharacterized protein n=2 Tax=Bacillus thuringiensis TaxID=1428 RepID=A0A9W3VFL6_BACTU|nr:hypothetical protein AXW78_12540 [Bacillus thuringiensis]AYF84369.1 hypothetical protein D7J84_25805 [Bacillus thuringiensis]PNK35756.1 hypothetical protein CBR55_23985 [Bacillus thuringiensis]